MEDNGGGLGRKLSLEFRRRLALFPLDFERLLQSDREARAHFPSNVRLFLVQFREMPVFFWAGKDLGKEAA